MKITPILLSLLFCGNLAAQDLKIVGTITQEIPLSTPKLSHSSQAHKKKIKLLKVKLSQKTQQHLAERVKKSILNAPMENKTSFPSKLELGMNNVPVLDQGQHGTCVTFAVTAAIDAALEKGDYISQLCQLQLGNYLADNGYTPSGWDGSWGQIVLSQMSTFGFMNKERQLINGCGDLTEYPLDDEDAPTSSISPEDFHQFSEALDPYDSIDPIISWSSLLDANQALQDRIDPNKILDAVKATLNANDRLTFGVLLWDVDMGVAGAVGRYKANNDTWVLTPEIARDTYLRPVAGGHEMIITGYNDNAISVDEQGRKYKGLLTLRNSWGDKVGNEGDFYMSYEYFKLFVIETSRIRGDHYDLSSQ